MVQLCNFTFKMNYTTLKKLDPKGDLRRSNRLQYRAPSKGKLIKYIGHFCSPKGMLKCYFIVSLQEPKNINKTRMRFTHKI